MKLKIFGLIITLLLSIGFYSAFSYYSNFTKEGYITIENIVYGDNYNTSSKGDVVNGNINFKFDISGVMEDLTPKTCSSNIRLDVINGLTSIDTANLGCNFNDFKQRSVVEMTIYADLDDNGNFTDLVDYSSLMRSLFETFYDKTYLDTTIIQKEVLLNSSDGKIKYDKLPF